MLEFDKKQTPGEIVNALSTQRAGKPENALRLKKPKWKPVVKKDGKDGIYVGITGKF